MNIDRLIRDSIFKKIDKRGLRRSEGCPFEIVLNDYLAGKMSIGRRVVLEKHFVNCGFCLEQLDLAQKALKRKGGRKNMKEKLQHFSKKWGWFSGMAVSFGISFLFRRYFLQFLVLTVIFGVKWVFEAGSTKTLIMVYDAWRKRDKEDADSLNRHSRFLM